MPSSIRPLDPQNPDWLGDLGYPDPAKVAAHMGRKAAELSALVAAADANGRQPGDLNCPPPAA